MANTQNFGISTSSNEWPESDGVLDIDFAQFERHDAHVPQPNLRVSSFPRTAATPSHSPSPSAAAAAASSPLPRPPRNCPGPLRRNGEETKRAAVAGQKRARDVEDDDVDEVTGSLDVHVGQSHHYLGLPLPADCSTHAATATWGEEASTRRAGASAEERLPSLYGPMNAEPYFLAWTDDGHEDAGDAEDGMDCRDGTESGLQQQQHDGHHNQFLPEDAQMLWMDQQSLPLGSETPGWDESLPASDILMRSYGHRAAHNHRLHVLDAGPSSVADMTYQQLAATATIHTSNQQTLLPLEARDNLFQLPGPACGGNSTHQVIYTSDNCIVKPELDHHDGRLGFQACAEEHRNEPPGPWHNEPFPFHGCNDPCVHDAWQTDVASARDNTVMSTLAMGNDESVPWSHPAGWLSPFSASLVLMEDQKAAGLGDGGASYEAIDYFDGGGRSPL
ncbi:hypothetical protein E4U53_003879 [Claviceps sorghi]|nr:hypothetical protein E4U53_003879 [Claviceps sorghi]